MSQLVILGTRESLATYLSRFPQVEARGGHTVVEYDSAADARSTQTRLARSIFNALVTEYRFTALDTSVPEAPVRVTTFDPHAQTEVTLIPQVVGG